MLNPGSFSSKTNRAVSFVVRLFSFTHAKKYLLLKQTVKLEFMLCYHSFNLFHCLCFESLHDKLEKRDKTKHSLREIDSVCIREREREREREMNMT